MRTIHAIAAFCFYLLGSLALLGIALAWQGIATAFISGALRVIDLPLIGAGLTYAGTSLLQSVGADHPPRTLVAIVSVVALAMFLSALWMNFFAMPTPLA